MKTASGFDQCYNGQIAVDGQSQMIVATDLSHCAADQGALLPLVNRVRDTLGTDPRFATGSIRGRREKVESVRRHVEKAKMAL